MLLLLLLGVAAPVDRMVTACIEQRLGAYVSWTGHVTCIECYTATFPRCDSDALHGCTAGHLWFGAPCIATAVPQCYTRLFRDHRACSLSAACHWTGTQCTSAKRRVLG